MQKELFLRITTFSQKTYTRLVALPQGLFFPQKTYTRLVALPQGLFSLPKRPILVFSAPAGAFFPLKNSNMCLERPHRPPELSQKEKYGFVEVKPYFGTRS